MTTTQFNIERLDYLLALFGMSKDELLSSLNEGRKKPISLDDIFGKDIKISLFNMSGIMPMMILYFSIIQVLVY